MEEPKLYTAVDEYFPASLFEQIEDVDSRNFLKKYYPQGLHTRTINGVIVLSENASEWLAQSRIEI